MRDINDSLLIRVLFTYTKDKLLMSLIGLILEFFFISVKYRRPLYSQGLLRAVIFIFKRFKVDLLHEVIIVLSIHYKNSPAIAVVGVGRLFRLETITKLIGAVRVFTFEAEAQLETLLQLINSLACVAFKVFGKKCSLGPEGVIFFVFREAHQELLIVKM